MIAETIFYLFASLALISGIQVIWSRNPVESVLYLVLVFVNASGLFLLLEVEYIALIFVIVYVGAIAVLFLFVVMMLSPKIEIEDTKSNFYNYIGLGLFLGGLFISEIYLLVTGDIIETKSENSYSYSNWLTTLDGENNLIHLGQILYTYYFYYFLLAGFVLLVAIIGGIVLTLQTKSSKIYQESKRQQVFEQLSRDSKRAVFLINNKNS